MHNTRSFKRIIAIIVCLSMLISTSMLMSSCGVKQQNTAVKDAGRIVAETDKELTIIDQAGREVTVPKNIDSIALCYRVVIRFLLSLEQGDKIKGIGKTEDFLEELQPSLKECVDVGLGVADIEALAKLQPELFIHKAYDTETLEAVQKLGIASIGINVETPEDMVVALDILGKVCGAEEKSKQLIEYYNGKLEEFTEITSGLEEKSKKTAIVMGTSIGKLADGSMLQGEMLEKAGAINCAAELEATELWPTAGAEQIFEWNPDYIFITGSESAAYTAEDIYKDKAWSELKAVKNRHVYTIPATEDSWEFPGVVSAIGIEFMLRIMYPELITDEKLEKDVNEFYMLSYGRSFDRERLGY